MGGENQTINGRLSALGMSEDELFKRVHPYTPEQIHFSRSFSDMQRSNNMPVVEITKQRGRSDAMKRGLFARIAGNQQQAASLAPDDVLILSKKTITPIGPLATAASPWHWCNSKTTQQLPPPHNPPAST